MPRRGLIIAIEHYANLEEGLAGNLDGTHQSALDFRRWLIEEHGVAPGDIVFCAEDPALPERTAGATKPELEDELDRLRAAGFNQTEQLYCYIAGHGFTYEDGDNQRIADVLLLQDYRRRTVSGNACVRLDELRTWLMGALGPGDHYYFVDCCRNRVGTAEISVGQLGLSRVTGSSGAPKTYTLYSTIDGSVAAVESGFSRELIDGLNGTGRAKEWREDDAAMQVRFDPLSDYVRRHLGGGAGGRHLHVGRRPGRDPRACPAAAVHARRPRRQRRPRGRVHARDPDAPRPAAVDARRSRASAGRRAIGRRTPTSSA